MPADKASDGTTAGRWGLIAGIIGFGFSIILRSKESAVIGQNVVALACACFFAVSNFIDSSETRKLLLSGTCSFLGGVLGLCASELVGSSLAYMGLSETASTPFPALSLYMFLALVMLFHSVEFAFVVSFHPEDVKFGSFMLAPVPSAGYCIAMLMALMEWWLEQYFFLQTLQPKGIPERCLAAVTVLGFLGGILGWALRAAALFTAKSNFTHIVAWRKRTDHRLVTCGVYQICRHPSYLGWFLWSVCSQITLLNPISFFGYAAVSWAFFADRIPTEEAYLMRFFGQEYLEYAKRVPCGLPWISQMPTLF